MKKRVDTFRLALQLFVAKLGLRGALEDAWDNVPENESGPEVDFGDYIAEGEMLFDDGVAKIEELLGEKLPLVTEDDLEPEPEPEPEPDPLFWFKYKTRIMNSGKQMSHHDGDEPATKQDIFEIPGCGRDYGDAGMLIWSDGNTLLVPNLSGRQYQGPPGKIKYQPGCGDGTTPGCEAYAKVGTHPEWMDLYHNVKPGDTPDPDPDPEWKRVYFGGDKSLGKHGHDDRDRLWWTEIHGAKPGKPREWSRKFPLPRTLDDRPVSIDFRFADGQSLRVSNSQKMAMNSNGPKYRPEKPGEPNPKKQHPKVGAIPGTKPDWVEYRIK